jgi:FMN phosphatase YigB (HAD superfamily)
MSTDTNSEAVERQRGLLRHIVWRILRREDVSILRIPVDPSHDVDMICDAADNLLGALAAERDSYRRNMEALAELAQRYGAERDALRAENARLRAEVAAREAAIRTEEREQAEASLLEVLAECGPDLAAQLRAERVKVWKEAAQVAEDTRFRTNCYAEHAAVVEALRARAEQEGQA